MSYSIRRCKVRKKKDFRRTLAKKSIWLIGYLLIYRRFKVFKTDLVADEFTALVMGEQCRCCRQANRVRLLLFRAMGLHARLFLLFQISIAVARAEEIERHFFIVREHAQAWQSYFMKLKLLICQRLLASLMFDLNMASIKL